MAEVNISYVVCTKNRLPFLKILFNNFFNQISNDEEIIVIDGNSTDGSKEYLQELYNDGIIHQFLSEPDKNQAHGWNKGMLLAQGKVIKKIIDDDVHSYIAIQQCKKYMLDNPEIDICISDNLETQLLASESISCSTRKEQFLAWKSGRTKSFTFSDMSMLIRRSSLSFIGLFDTQFRMLDWEYSLRCSFLQAKIAYYSGYNTLAVSTPGNITSTTPKSLLSLEGKIGQIKYNYIGDRSEISPLSRLKIFIGKLIGYRKPQIAHKQLDEKFIPDLLQTYQSLYQQLEKQNQEGSFDFYK